MTTVIAPNGDEKHIRAIVFREGDVYVAQCLEYDIATQATDIEELLIRLDRTIEAEFTACEREGRAAKTCIAPASNYYHSLWDKRSINLTQVNVASPAGKRVQAAFAKAA